MVSDAIEYKLTYSLTVKIGLWIKCDTKENLYFSEDESKIPGLNVLHYAGEVYQSIKIM